MRPPSIDERMRVRLAALLGGAPALGEGICRLTQTFGAQAVLDPGLGHGQAVGLGGAPAFSGEAAVEGGATSGTDDPAWRVCRCHEGNLRPEGNEGKIVIKAKANPRMADA